MYFFYIYIYFILIIQNLDNNILKNESVDSNIDPQFFRYSITKPNSVLSNKSINKKSIKIKADKKKVFYNNIIKIE